jgi:PAS domain S-box-containing protein
MKPLNWFGTELDPLLAVVAATIAADGRLCQGNAGYLRLIGVKGPTPKGLRVDGYFVQPDFASLLSRPADGNGEIHRGLLTMADAHGLTGSLRARVWRSGSGLRLLAEYDIEDIERLTTTLLELNGNYAAMQAELTQTHFRLRHANAELARREASLAASDARQRAIIEAVPMALAIVDSLGNIVLTNKAFTEQLGYSLADIPTLSEWWQLSQPDPSRRLLVMANWETALRRLDSDGESIATLEETIICKDRSLRIFFACVTSVGGPPASQIITLEDVTERRRNEAQLAQYRDHLEAMIGQRTAALEESCRTARDIQQAMDGAGISIYRLDLESGHILYVNNHAAEILGYSIEQTLRLNIADIDPSADPATFGQLRARLAEQGRLQIESCHQTKDGRNFPVEITLYYGAATAEMAAHSIAFVKDISDRKAAESALAAVEASRRAGDARLRVESAAKMESRKLEALGTLATGIAHDFNNILGSIVGFSEMTGDTLPEGSTAKHNIEQILGASFRARDLIARMLTFARQSPLIPVPVDVVAEVREALALLCGSLKPSVHVSLRNGMDAAQAPALILADPTQIQQIVMNLVINAAYAITEHGTIRIDIDPLSQIQDKPPQLVDGLCLAVSDDGCGMTPEVLKHMYDPFFTTRAHNEGCGLGLSVVYGIVTELGGVIDVRSRIDGGTTGTEFRVFLPLTNDTLQIGGTHDAHFTN